MQANLQSKVRQQIVSGIQKSDSSFSKTSWGGCSWGVRLVSLIPLLSFPAGSTVVRGTWPVNTSKACSLWQTRALPLKLALRRYAHRMYLSIEYGVAVRHRYIYMYLSLELDVLYLLML